MIGRLFGAGFFALGNFGQVNSVLLLTSWNYMIRVCASLGLICLLAGAEFGQTTETAPKFEVADIHNSPRILQPVVRGPFYTSGRYEIRFATMLDLVRMAYDVDPEKVYGGPNWLEMDRFDIFAKTPGNPNSETRRRMLQLLLVDRFHLVVHEDKRPMTAWALTAGKHPQLKQSDDSGEPGCKFSVENAPSGPPTPGGGPIKLPVIVHTCHNISMAAFAGQLLSLPGAGQYLNNRPVVDQTELKGNWDFTFRMTPKVPAGIPVTGENIPIFAALENLGLKLESATAPLPVIVVDSVNQKPTGNSPDVEKAFPPPPTEFDVAEIKRSAPDSGGRGGRQPEIKNGRLYLPGISVKNLIQAAWDINGDEFMVNAPKWMNDDRVDIIAKAPAGVAVGDLTPSRNGITVNIDALRPMLKTLVNEEFKLKTHMEDRPVNTFVLTAVKPKMQKADPASRTNWHEGTDTETKSKNANSSLGRLVTCQNVTMKQFAEMLSVIAPGYVHTEVLDATGLEGGWDFTFSFSPVGALNLAGGQGSGDSGSAGSGGTPTASDPNGAISLPEALTRQLGLKLETQKKPRPVLVIDSAERKTFDN